MSSTVHKHHLCQTLVHTPTVANDLLGIVSYLYPVGTGPESVITVTFRLSAGQSHTRMERSSAQGPVAGGPIPPAADQQLPRVHRARLPCPLRGQLRARNQ